MCYCTPCQALEPFQNLNAKTHYLVILKKLFECPVCTISLILNALNIPSSFSIGVLPCIACNFYWKFNLKMEYFYFYWNNVTTHYAPRWKISLKFWHIFFKYWYFCNSLLFSNTIRNIHCTKSCKIQLNCS